MDTADLAFEAVYLGPFKVVKKTVHLRSAYRKPHMVAIDIVSTKTLAAHKR